MRSLEKSGRLAAIAKHRLVNGGPDTCRRIEHEAILAMENADWNRARKLLDLRFEMRPAPTAEERATIDRILVLID